MVIEICSSCFEDFRLRRRWRGWKLAKHPLLGLGKRVQLAKHICEEFPNVEVKPFDGLKNFIEENHGTSSCGARAVSDFEYEFQMVGMNRQTHA